MTIAASASATHHPSATTRAAAVPMLATAATPTMPMILMRVCIESSVHIPMLVVRPDWLAAHQRDHSSHRLDAAPGTNATVAVGPRRSRPRRIDRTETVRPSRQWDQCGLMPGPFDLVAVTAIRDRRGAGSGALERSR